MKKKIKVPKEVMRGFEILLEACLNNPEVVSMAKNISIGNGFNLGKQYLYAELRIIDCLEHAQHESLEHLSKEFKKSYMQDWDKPGVRMTVLEKGGDKHARKHS